jgi:hypothetical protein
MKGQILMATLLLSAVAFFPRTSFAHDTASGCASTTDVIISNEAAFATLCKTTMTLTGHTHFCVATASAEAEAPGGSKNNDYLFVISTAAGGPGVGSPWERKIELNDNADPVDDPDTAVPSTVRYLTLGAGTWTFYWLAKPVDRGDAALKVADYSMGVVCVDGV